MENIFPKLLIDLLSISVTFSFVLMVLIQKCKRLKCINYSWKVWILNFIFSFTIGIPFAMHFYNLKLEDSIWVGFFSFIGAASVYELLKNQTILSYTPNRITEQTIEINVENEIRRDDV